MSNRFIVHTGHGKPLLVCEGPVPRTGETLTVDSGDSFEVYAIHHKVLPRGTSSAHIVEPHVYASGPFKLASVERR